MRPLLEITDAGWLELQSGKRILRYEISADGHLLFLRWEAHDNIDEMARALRVTTELIEHFRPVAVLSDATSNDLDWTELIPLMRYEELPKALAAGMKIMASVTSLDPNDAISHHSFHAETSDEPAMYYEVFNDLAEAREWVEMRLQRLGYRA